jgi:subtilase family serine protease
VVAVGGTTLPLDGAGNRTGAETAWNGSGGGLSAYVAEPAYQSSYGISSGGKRAIPDVAAVADPNTGVAVYSSTRYNGQKGWFVVGGTSLSSPLWAGFIALADQGRGTALTDGHSALYNLATGSSYGTDYHDVQSGTNGTCGAICTAGPGYDEVTGLGTPAVNQLVPGLVSQP